MTITTEAAPLSYPGDDVTVTAPITWKYFHKDHVVATLRNADGSETAWSRPSDYGLTDAGVDSGGTLTATTAWATGTTLVITLEPPNTQIKGLPLGGPFPSPTVEAALDLAAQRDTKQTDLLNRMLRVPKTDTQSDSDLELPIDSVRASKYLACDASGSIIASTGPTGDSSIPVSAYMETVLDDADAETARGTLVAAPLSAFGADIASANALAVDIDGNLFDVTGTTTITSLNTRRVGDVVTLQFDGALTLTHHATDLILPGGANITTAAGDIATFVEYATGDWRCVGYTRADGGAVKTAGIEFNSDDIILIQTADDAAPTGWTKLTSTAYEDSAIRVVTTPGAGRTTGDVFSTIFAAGRVTANYTGTTENLDGPGGFSTPTTHTHAIDMDVNYCDVMAIQKD